MRAGYPRGRAGWLEYIDNAQNQGVAAARSMLDKGLPYAQVLLFWSEQDDLTLEYVGYGNAHEAVVFRGTLEQGSWCAFYLRHGPSVGRPGRQSLQGLAATRQLIDRQTPVDTRQLADKGIDLHTLAAGPGGYTRRDNGISRTPPHCGL